MTRISSLFVASTFAILPISAFAQQTVAPVKTAPPASVTAPAPAGAMSTPGTVKVAPATTADAKPDAKPLATKTPVAKTPSAKGEVHGMTTVKTHHAKAHVPAKTAEPARS